MLRFHTVISDVKQLTPTILELSFQRQDRQPFASFLPGQYATLSFPNYSTIHGERSFSIASSATDLMTLRFGIRVGGPYTKALRRLRPGDEAIVNAPFGSFTFDPIRDQAAVLIAGGIGVTPFMSMIRTAAGMGITNALHLVYCIRSVADGAFVDELEKLTQRSPNIRITYVVGDKRVPSGDGRFFPGNINRELLGQVLGHNLWQQSYFLCGPPKFMGVVTKLFVSLGLPKSAIRTERFSVSTTAIIEGGSPLPKWAFASWGIATAAVLGYIAHTEREKRESVATTAIVVPTAVTNTTIPVTTAPIANLNTAPVVPVTNTNTSSPVNTTTVPTTPKVTPPPTVTTPKPITMPVVQPPIQPRTTVS